MPVPQGRVPVTYLPGPWVALASPDGPGNPDQSADIVMLADLDSASPVAMACWNALEQGAGLDALLGVILREGLRSVPSFVLAAKTADSVRVLVSGKARAEITGAGGAETLGAADGPAGSPWLERTVAGAGGVRLVAQTGSAEPGSTEPGPPLPLFGGVVLASAVTLGDVGAATGTGAAATDIGAAVTQVPAPAAQDNTDADAERTTDEELATAASSDTIQPPEHQPPEHQPPAAPSVVDSGLIEALPFRVPSSSAEAQTMAVPPVGPRAEPEPDPEPEPESAGTETAPVAPTVLAVACPNGHLGPPYSGQCRVCGATIAPQEPYDVSRPVLGILNMSTGDMVPLDREVVLGRSPSSDETDPQLRPHLVQLASPGNDISRNHVRVSIEGWHVLVTDLDSTNGTVVTQPNQQPVRLRPHDAFTIVPGTLINIADEVNVRYEVPA